MSTRTAERLEQLRREVDGLLAPAPTGRPRRSRARVRGARRVVILALTGVAMVLLPFLLYVRTSVWLYLHGGLAPWPAVVAAALATLGIAAIYAAWAAGRLPVKVRATTLVRWVAVPLAATWCAYSALYLARTNAKTDDIRAYYGAVNPVLRLALATAILGDPDLVVTDMRRVPEDYARMGLEVNERTKHYRQANGWVHAADLRTLGHGELRNRSLELYFRVMGFQTLRHVGTADHLHVQLPIRLPDP